LLPAFSNLFARGLQTTTSATSGWISSYNHAACAPSSKVTGGPYRLVRHPFYLTAAMLMLGAALLSANALIALCGVIVMTLLVVRTGKEERKLAEKFGDAYRDYMRRTGRFVPRWWRE
jgi:protein-S-isoprenylcysteine O-methyltransferase Ste14